MSGLCHIVALPSLYSRTAGPEFDKVAGQPPRAEGERNQDGALCAFIPSFFERLIGTLRRECLDRTLFWTATDLEAKLVDFQHYYNEHGTHAGRQGHPPVTGVNADHSLTMSVVIDGRSIVEAYTKTPNAA